MMATKNFIPLSVKVRVAPYSTGFQDLCILAAGEMHQGSVFNSMCILHYLQLNPILSMSYLPTGTAAETLVSHLTILLGLWFLDDEVYNKSEFRDLDHLPHFLVEK